MTLLARESRVFVHALRVHSEAWRESSTAGEVQRSFRAGANE
jgi:hypothetical protein